MKKLLYSFGLLLATMLASCGGAFQQKVNVGPGAGTVEDHTFEILLMLGVSFALGLWLGWILWNKFKLMVDGLRLENENLVQTVKNLQAELEITKAELGKAKTELSISNEKNSQISTENLTLQGKLSDLELDYQHLLTAKQNLDAEISQSYASTPESADVPMEVITSPVDILLEDLAEVSEDSPLVEVEPAILVAPLAPEITDVEEPEKINFSDEISVVADLPEVDLPKVEMPEIHLPPVVAPVTEIEEITETVIIPIGAATAILPIEEEKIEETAADLTENYSTEVVETALSEVPVEIIIEEPVVDEASEVPTDYVAEVTEITEEKTDTDVPLMNLTDYATPLVVPTLTERRDDLKVVEGIGPKIEAMLYRNGVYSFSQLAATPVNRLKEMLTAEGSSYAMHDPGTWPAQALLAANAEWENLRAYQSFLNAGKRPN